MAEEKHMFRAIMMAVILVIASGSAQQAIAQTPLVIVPDNPPGGGGGGGWNAIVTTNLNMRSGPGTRYRVIHVLQNGERVEVVRCQANWCFVNARVESGWASRNYLSRTGGGGVTRPPARQVCFFEGTRFTGRSFCSQPGDSSADLGPWRNRIASMTVRGGQTVQVCAERNFRDCDAFDRDMPTLPWWLDRSISSYRVFH